MRVQVFDRGGQFCFESRNDRPLKVEFNTSQKRHCFSSGPISLSPGNYYASVVVYSDDMVRTIVWSHLQAEFTVAGEQQAKSAFVLPLSEITSCQ